MIVPEKSISPGFTRSSVAVTVMVADLSDLALRNTPPRARRGGLYLLRPGAFWRRVFLSVQKLPHPNPHSVSFTAYRKSRQVCAEHCLGRAAGVQNLPVGPVAFATGPPEAICHKKDTGVAHYSRRSFFCQPPAGRSLI